MEVAVTVIVAAGIQAVIAESFSRTFYRNAINNGLIVIVAKTAGIKEGDAISIAMDASGVVLRDATTGTVLDAAPPNGIAVEILAAGGLVNFVRSAPAFGGGV